MVNLDMQQFKAEFFKALAHPMRIKILEILAEGEKSVNEIQNIVGGEGSGVSQQLMILRNKNIVSGVKQGNRVIYSLKDPLIIELLQVARQIFNNQLESTISIFDKSQERDGEEHSNSDVLK